MAVNLFKGFDMKKMALKYAQESLVASKLSNNYDFTGNKSVTVMTPVTVAMSEYNREASGNRYGTPTELQDTTQEMIVNQDRSFTLIIDKGNYEDQGRLKRARAIVAQQLRERAIPEMDKYMLGELVKNAGTTATGTPSKTNICELITAGTTALDDAEVPASNRTLFITAKNYAMLRLSPEFIGVDRLADKSLSKGVVGEYDGMAVVKVPAGRVPEGMNFVIVHRDAATAPIKLDEHKIHEDPPGISGALIEGRQYYDCFVLDAKAKGVYAHTTT